MDDWSVVLIRLPAVVLGGYVTWRSALAYLERRRRGQEKTPIDRVWRYFISLVTFVAVLLGIVLLVDVGLPLFVLDLLFVAFALSALGMLICGFLVGWYWWDDILDRSKENGVRKG